MKTMKKLFALLLALTMVFGLAATGFAADTESGNSETNGTITVLNPAFETTYNAYRLLDLESWDNTEGVGAGEATATDPTDDLDGAYSYKLNQAWCGFFGYKYESNKFVKIATTPAPYGAAFIKKIDQFGEGYITWNDNPGDGKTIAEFAQKALEWGESQTADATLTTKKAAEYEDKDKTEGKLNPQKLVFDSTKNDDTKYEGSLGYYLVSTNLGALCSLNTTDSNAEIVEKNAGPGLEKTVKEGDDYGEKATANVGDTVEFKIVVTAYPGAENYVIHDAMSDGLTFNVNSVKVTSKATSEGSEEKNLNPTTDYEVKTTDICSTEDDESTAEKDCDFHIEFKEDYLKTITKQTTITVTYTATVNENAVIDGEENETDKNEAKLDYGDDHHTEWDDAKVYTFTFTVVKVDGTSNEKALADAEFELYTAGKDGKISTEKVAFDVRGISDNEDNGDFDDAEEFAARDITFEDEDTYVVCQKEESQCSGKGHTTIFKTPSDGKIIFEGLDAGTYYLKETKAPDGYNKLKYPIKVEIDEEGKVAYWMADASSTDSNIIYTTKNTVDPAGVNQIKHTFNIANNTGTELPSTGGMGTTLFYVVGSLMVLGAAVLLVAKKRSNT